MRSASNVRAEAPDQRCFDPGAGELEEVEAGPCRYRGYLDGLSGYVGGDGVESTLPAECLSRPARTISVA